MKKKYLYILASIIFVLSMVILIIIASMIRVKTDTSRVVLKSLEDVPVDSWTKLAQKKIFFGHQSVGYNIINGIKDIMRTHDYIRLNIVETTDPAEFENPVFGHAQIGINTNPASKTEEFRNILDSGLGDKVDIAFMKFCYLDVTWASEPKEIFDNYNTVLKDLKSRYPHAIFLNLTVPICSAPNNFKGKLKESIKFLIGKPGLVDNNIRRLHYNTILERTLSRSEPVFDLADIETISSGNLRHFVKKGDENVPVMASENTDDGCHLNNLGRIKMAEQLLIMLANMASRS